MSIKHANYIPWVNSLMSPHTIAGGLQVTMSQSSNKVDTKDGLRDLWSEEKTLSLNMNHILWLLAKYINMTITFLLLSQQKGPGLLSYFTATAAQEAAKPTRNTKGLLWLLIIHPLLPCFWLSSSLQNLSEASRLLNLVSYQVTQWQFLIELD